MERSESLGRLPVAYRLALELRERGAGPEEIARSLGVEIEAVGLLLEIGAEKLAVIEAQDG